MIVLRGNTLLFHKDSWYENEILLAQSTGMTYKDGSIVADLCCTCNIAVYAFMRTAFLHSFLLNPETRNERDALFAQLTLAYQEVAKRVYEKASGLALFDSLFDHQREALPMMVSRKYNLLAHEQGLGKSVVAAATSMICGYKKTLIICPAICKYNWREELMQWGVDAKDILVVTSKHDEYDVKKFKGQFITVNYDIIKQTANLFIDVEHIVIDECHYIKNRKSLRSMGVRMVRANNRRAKVSLLSGTPVKNRVDDMFNYLDLIDHPLSVMGYSKFLERYSVTVETRWGIKAVKGKNLEELSDMLSNFLIRKRKEECLTLPDKIVRKYYFEMEDYKEAYDAALLELLSMGDKYKINIESSVHMLNLITTKSKVKNIIQICEDILDEGRKVVIFTSYTDPIKMMSEYFGERAVVVDGSVPVGERQAVINSFRSDESKRVFIGNMVAAGVGINLQNACDVIFCNFPFTPDEILQASDRLHRIGQLNDVNIYYTVCKGTSDEIMYSLISRKMEDINSLIDRGNQTKTFKNIPSEIFRLLRKNYHGQNRKVQKEKVSVRGVFS